ncbi:hypothetical protein E8E13_001741 [Curvularia kusanoi]|uniref:Putative gamma-glutamylcyclotransferase n=1 Tax=Curvularia kusanoi TaxID=90978 RepID=A0A9P4TBL1_CURKU|nr:hypothetical protein E8E13_001741 [Curvularia kusanoi]
MSHTAFFYGTLMAPPVLHRVIWGSSTPPTPAHASLLSIRPAILHAHVRRRVKGADYPAVTPSSATDSCVRGTLVTGLTDGDIWRLDVFEGDEYKRRGVKVRALTKEGGAGEKEGEEVDAQTYIWVAGEQRLDPSEWDFEHFVKEKMGRWVGEEVDDEGFKDVDDAVKALQDPTGGRGVNGDITRRLESGGREAERVLGSAV